MAEQAAGLPTEMAEEIAASVHELIGGKPMGEHVESATSKLEDDEIVGFQLVAVREADEGYQTVSQRAVSPKAVRGAAADGTDPEEVVDRLHASMCEVYDDEIREADR